MKNRFLSRNPKRERLSPVQRNARTRARRTGAAHDEEARALWLFCKNGPDLTANHSETHGTIPTVCYFTDKPSKEPVFATATPSAPMRAHRRGGAGTGRLRRPDRPFPAPKCEPMLT